MANSRRARTGGLFKEFKEFALKGNVVDLAVAVIIGGAFGRIISSLVEDILMPAIINPVLSQAGTNWREAVVGPGILLGSFIGALVDFVIIALILFLVVRSIQRMQRKQEVEEAAAAPAEPSPEEKLNATLERLAEALERRTLS